MIAYWGKKTRERMDAGREALGRRTHGSAFTSAPAKNTHGENTAVKRDIAIII